jgi:AraC family transcriptional regulator, glycine betaine-responsive activator
MPKTAIAPNESDPNGLHDLGVRKYGFLLLDNFSLLALGAAVDPLRIANMVVGRRVYD